MLPGYATVFVPSYAGATPGQKPFVGISLRNQGMDQASPKAWQWQVKQIGFMRAEPVFCDKSHDSPVATSMAVHFPSLPRLPTNPKKIWGNGSHGGRLKNSLAHSCFNKGFKKHRGTISNGSF